MGISSVSCMKRSTILLIEDDGFFSQIMKRTLEERGFEVIWSANGEDGVRQALTALPDAIVLDVMMPKKNGFQVLDELKEHEVSRDIPVVMLTSMSSREDIERCLSVGACDYLIKTHHTPEEVARRVVRALEKPSGFSVPEMVLVIGTLCLLGLGVLFQYQGFKSKQDDVHRIEGAYAVVTGLQAAYDDGYHLNDCQSGDQVSACRLCQEETCQGEDRTRMYLPEDIVRALSIRHPSCTASSTKPCISTVEFTTEKPVPLETVRVRFFLEKTQGTVKGGITHIVHADGTME